MGACGVHDHSGVLRDADPVGTPRDMMIAQLINQQIDDLLAWGFAGAIAVLLLLFAMVLIAVYDRYAGIDRLWG